MKLKITTLIFTAAGMITAQAQTGWNTYTNTVAGSRVSYPSNLTRTPYKEWASNGDPSSPEQWRTTIFASPDKKVTLEISTHPNSLQKRLQDFFHEDVARRTEGGDEINYSVLKNGWFVVSRTNAKRFEFYEKFFLFDEWWINFDFVYPSAQRATYDPMVAKIAKYFFPQLTWRTRALELESKERVFIWRTTNN